MLVFATVGGKAHYLQAVNETTRLPRPSTFFLTDDAPIIKGGAEWQTHGFVLKHLKPNRKKLAETHYYAVSQLRPAYAARYLGLLGSYQSRIGVDYVKFGGHDN